MRTLVLSFALILCSTPSLSQDGGEPRAVSGSPFIAYIGDSVQLSAEWSTGPEPLSFQWTQIEGPPVQLDDATAMRPRFTAATEGTHAFHVVVGQGRDISEPDLALVHVVATDLPRGQGENDRGCHTLTAAPWWAPALILLPLARRRR